MKNTGTLKVTTPTEREVMMVRVFDAPRRMVFDAFTKPELLKRWFGPRSWSLAVCEVDFRVGRRLSLRAARSRRNQPGDARPLSRNRAARALHPHGIVRRLSGRVPGHECLGRAGRQDHAQRHGALPLLGVRDIIMKSGMEHGAAETYDRLAELLAANSKEES
jgi:hypothetical protein